MDFDSMDLAGLFAAADSIGDKYLSQEEIEERDRQMSEVMAELIEYTGCPEVEA